MCFTIASTFTPIGPSSDITKGETWKFLITYVKEADICDKFSLERNIMLSET